MDKNMIHIDDLVRQRLDGGEESERPGAWLSMRELLDKEMPVSSGYNWRRVIGYFTALLLITSASFGGYRLYNGRSGGSLVADGSGSNPGAPGGNSGSYSAITNNDSRQGIGTLTTNSASTSESISNQTGSVNNHISTNPVSTTKATDPLNTTSGNNQKASALIALNSGGNSGIDANRDDNKPSVVKRNAMAHLEGSVSKEPAKTNAHRRGTSNKAAVGNNGGIASSTVRARRSQRAVTSLGLRDVPSLQLASSATRQVTNPLHPELARVKHDSVERLELVQRRVYDAGANRTYYRIDTFPAGKVARDIYLPSKQDDQPAIASVPAKPKNKGHRGPFGHKHHAEDLKAVAASGQSNKNADAMKNDLASASTPIPNASMKSDDADATKSEANALNANSGAATKHFQLLDMQKVQAVIDQVKRNIAGIQMYPGVMAGINASMFTPNALGGFQFGLTSMFVLNDWWSLMLEPKFMLRFNTGSSLRDDYKEVIDGSGEIKPDPQYPGYLSYTWTDHTIKHSFNYDLVSTIEVPIMLRRHWNQVYVQGGVNLVFSSPISAKEVTQPQSDYKVRSESRPGLEPQPYITNDHPNVTMADFGNRFGTGYVISGGYMFSPAVYVDARLTQTVWDNSKTSGAKLVSRDLLRTPSIQISLGYRFNSKK